MKKATSEDTLGALVHIALHQFPRGEDGPRPKSSCHACIHARQTDSSHHLLCAKPCASVTGSTHGIERGWFMYPLNYDPVWRTSECEHFEPRAEQSVTQSVKQSS